MFPCVPGISNEYHVTIHDGDTLLWESREAGFIGRTVVESAPMPHVELVDMTGIGCDGRLLACEHGTVRLRLYARNPYFGSDMTDVRLDLPLPTACCVMGWQLHHHDNPMDAVTPPPEDLVADGVVTLMEDYFRVDVSRLETRFNDRPAVAPPVFRDLFEVDLLLETPPGGFGSDITFPGLTVSGTVRGLSKSETSGPLVIPVVEPSTMEVSPAGSEMPLRLLPDKRTLTWEHCAPLAADTFNVYRGLLADLHAGGYGTCLAQGLAEPSVVDDESPGSGRGFFYLVSAVNCAGEGTLGADSLDRARVVASPCR
jgi:hypothetical protein